MIKLTHHEMPVNKKLHHRTIEILTVLTLLIGLSLIHILAGDNTFLQHNGLWKENAPRIIVTGPMGEPSGLIAKMCIRDSIRCLFL